MLRRSGLLPSHQRYELKKAIQEFWSHPKFDNPENAPRCAFSEVEGSVDKAVDLILHIRAHLNLVEWKIALISASVQEYLHSLEADPRENPDALISGLVHAALRNNEGYIADLKYDQVDELIKKFKSSLKLDTPPVDVKAEIEKILPSFNELLKETLSGSLEDRTGDLQHVLSSLKSLCSTLEHAKTQKEAPKTEIASPAAVEELSEKAQERDEKLAETADALEDAAAKLVQDLKIDDVPANDPKTTQSPLQAQTTSGSEKPSSPAVQAERTSSPAVKTEQPGSPAVNQEKTSSPAVPPAERTGSPTVQTEKPSSTTEEPAAPKQADQLRDSGVVKIQRVANEVALTKSKIEHVIDESQGLDYENLMKDPMQGEQVVDTLNKKCLRYSEDLMKDLLALDSVTTSDHTRPLRKQQINMIQDLLSDVDRIKDKLNSLKSTIATEKATKLAEQRALEPPAPEPAAKKPEEKAEDDGYKSDDEESSQETSKAAIKHSHNPQEAERALWSRLRLEPKFEISQDHSGYQLQAYIPGMNKEDINITTAQDGSLVVSGLRLPSPKDKAAMNRQLANQFPFAARSSHQDQETLMLRLGSGRYGSFEERFKMPGNVDTTNISASYQGNILGIVIPKVQQARRPQHTRGGYPPQYRNYGRPGFHDQNMFW